MIMGFSPVIRFWPFCEFGFAVALHVSKTFSEVLDKSLISKYQSFDIYTLFFRFVQISFPKDLLQLL